LRQQAANALLLGGEDGAVGMDADNKMKSCQYDLADTILHLGYKSTDTIERGKYIYECALLEYYKLLRQDPLWIGACESVVLLLSVLGYDDLCFSLIRFMLHPPPSTKGGSEGVDRDSDIRQYTADASENDFDSWIFGSPSGATFELSEYDKIRDIMPKQIGANTFLVPLMLIKMRQQTTERRGALLSPSFWKLEAETVEICRQVEYSAQFLLPVLRSLFPDSRQRWGDIEICALLADVDYRLHSNKYDRIEKEEDDKPRVNNSWENSCPTFWMMLKDCYAFTPGILDVLGIHVTPEDPPDAPTAGEYMDFVSYMAERQRNGTL